MRLNEVKIQALNRVALIKTYGHKSMMLSRIFGCIAIIFLFLATAVRAQEIGNNGGPLDQVVPVADDANVDADIRMASETEAEALLKQEFARFKELASNGVLDEAENAAKRIVELQIRVSGPESTEAAKALTNLAIIQHRTGQYVAAQQNFESAIDIIENNEDRLNAELINPLRGLGAAQLEGGRPDLAAQTFVRAVHITHVNEGPHNMDQIRLLEALAESNLRLGTPEDARDINDTIHALNLRHFAADPMELIPALMRRAAWQHRAGYIVDERATYRRAIRIIENTASKTDLALIHPLTQLGKSFFFVDRTGAKPQQVTLATMGEIYFKRALRIAENSPETTWEIETDARLALGDYYMFRNMFARARRIYREAWAALSTDEARLDKRRESLEQTVLLKQDKLPLYAGATINDDAPEFDQSVKQGTIIVSFSVTNRGRVSDLKNVEANPPEFTEMQRFLRREFRTRIYRPRFEDGDPVATKDLTFTHTYFYRQSDLDALRPETEDEK